MAIKEIVAFETSDKQKFDDRFMAERHEAKLEVAVFLDRAGVGRGGEWSQRMIGDFLIDNANAVCQLLEKLR